MHHTEDAQLRSMVREMLREILPKSVVDSRPEAREIRIETDADLTSFVALILELAADAATEKDLRAGRMQFTLAGLRNNAHAPDHIDAREVSKPTVAVPSLHIEKGAVTEKIVAQAASTGADIVLGARAVVTPLAKESARKNGVRIERRS